MTYHLPLLTGVMLALAACSDDEPQKIAKPIVQPMQHQTAPPSQLTASDTATGTGASSTGARVTETDRQKNASPTAKTSVAGHDVIPTTDGATISNEPSMPQAAEAPLLPNRDAAGKQESSTVATDNSGKNTRDDGSLPTPLDQGSSEGDLAITQGIRKAVTDLASLSVNAKNVKIITQDGAVTLRGPVADARERDAIYAIALAQTGTKSVNNLLEPIQK